MPAEPMMGSHGRANMDGVLGLLGTTHPCVLIQLLISVGFLVLGMGTMEISTLLPIPLYGCWGGLVPADLSGTEVCRGVSLLKHTLQNDTRLLYICGSNTNWWQPRGAAGGAVIVVVRVLVCFFSGVGADVVGRRRSAIVWLGVYFVFSFARSFAPMVEVAVICLTVEAAAAQAATISLLLIATEGSTQKECVRSACLVLLGHSLGVAVVIPVINSYLPNEMFRQLSRSLPSIIFVLFIFALPESVRWVISRGRLEYVAGILKRSHNILLEEELKPKILAVYQETRTSLSQAGCRGSSVKQSILPMFKTCSMIRVLVPLSLCSLAYGFATTNRLFYDSTPYSSIEDRLITCGVTELVALQLLGLVLARLPVRRVLPALCIMMAVMIPLSSVLQSEMIQERTCVGEVFVSCLGHISIVLTGVWLVMAAIRLTPTHSRGSMLGVVVSLSTLGHALSVTVIPHMPQNWDTIYQSLLWAGIVLLAGLLTTALPPTPPYLPDTLAHLTPRPVRKLDPGIKEEQRADEENTRL